MRCKQCGEHSDSARFCPNCGTPLGPQVIYVHDRHGLHLLMHATGVSRILLIFGLLLGLAGFAIFAFAVVDFMVQGFQQMEAGSTEPPDTSKMIFFLPVGIGFILAGTVLWTIGAILFRRQHY